MNRNTIITILMVILALVLINNYRHDHQHKTLADKVGNGLDEVGHELDEVGDDMRGRDHDL